MISAPNRHNVLKLIHEAHTAGARYYPACQVVGISLRTFQRWNQEGMNTQDKRPITKRKPPSNKLTLEEKEAIIATCVQEEYSDSNPTQIVPLLADQGIYIASESTFYRVLRAYKLQTKRTSTRSPGKRALSTHIATAPYQVWTWDITWLPGEIAGLFYKLYLIVDIFSRYIVQWEVHTHELQSHAKELITKAVYKFPLADTP